MTATTHLGGSGRPEGPGAAAAGTAPLGQAGTGGARPVVGVVGLGTMGGSMVRHLLAGGYRVVGADVAEPAAAASRKAGATVVEDAASVAATSDMVLLSLPSVAAFEAVVGGPGGLTSSDTRRARIVVETSTLPLETKVRAHDTLRGHGMALVDCPISGTGAQMAAKDAVFYASGEEDAVAEVEPVLAACGRGVFNLGALGNGTKLKLVANHLVAVHNASAAEALVLAERGGIDPAVALTALMAGAGTSRMLEVRGPMMTAGRYEPATMKVQTFMKDIDIITAFARQVGCPLPVFAAAAQLHLAALAGGWGGADTASVHGVVGRLAGSDS